jgi:putative membrane protein
MRSTVPTPWYFWAYIVGMAIAIPASVVWMLYARRKAIARQRANLPESPLQILERRFASGEISPEEYQDERYELEKGQ